MRKRRLVVTAACVAAFVGAGGSAALAGEVTGPFPNGKPLWTSTIYDANGDPIGHTLHGASECAFSGLNIPSEDGDPSRTQSYGQIVRQVGGGVLGGIPGTACNPTKASSGPES